MSLAYTSPPAPRHLTLAIETLMRELLLAEEAHDRALGEAQHYRLLALAALDYARGIHTTWNDNRNEYIDRRIEEVVS